MKKEASLLATIAVILLLLSLFSSSPIVADQALHATITPMVFNYLPFVAKEPTLTPTVTPTPTPTPTRPPTPGKPEPGDWSGEGVSFTVSTDSRQVCHFEKTWDYPGACGYALWHLDLCVDIDAAGHFFGQFSQHYPQPATFTYAGDFTSATTADGTWSVTRGTCSANGTWSASR